MAFASNFGRILSPTFQPNSQAKKAGGWWLAGGIDPDNCVAAYQPKGAASYAASKVNLAQPGTYDLADPATQPTWDAATGWTFAGGATQFFDTGYTGPATITLIVRYSGASTTGDVGIMGSVGPVASLLYTASAAGSGGKRFVHSGASQYVLPEVAADTIAVTREGGYASGSPVTTIWSTTQNLTMSQSTKIGNRGDNTTRYTGNILAVAIYSDIISAAEIAALTTRMNAL